MGSPACRTGIAIVNGGLGEWGVAREVRPAIGGPRDPDGQELVQNIPGF